MHSTFPNHDYEVNLKITYNQDKLEKLINNSVLVNGSDAVSYTHLDVYKRQDDKNEKPFFTIEQIKKKCEKEEFVSNSEDYHFDESKFDDFNTAKTVYIGAGKSGLSYRFYDKDKEVCGKYNRTLDEVGSWKRTEMQLRDEKAHAFAMAFHVVSGSKVRADEACASRLHLLRVRVLSGKHYELILARVEVHLH